MSAKHPLMICGHSAQGYRKVGDNDYVPCCVICDVTTQVPAENKPELTNRIATCCGKSSHKPSSYDLAFFEYRGPGSRHATDICECGYTKDAHDSVGFMKRHGRSNDNVLKHCAEKHGGTAIFTARGPHKYDLYYCGCRGWD